jgi:hypothetical protein
MEACTFKQLRAFIECAHNPELAAKDGMVYQVWNDGEITLQKGGDLLWARTVHQIKSPLPFGLSIQMPTKYQKETSYAFVTREDADQIRALMCTLAGEEKQ